jgi:hypothetical protein
LSGTVKETAIWLSTGELDAPFLMTLVVTPDTKVSPPGSVPGSLSEVSEPSEAESLIGQGKRALLLSGRMSCVPSYCVQSRPVPSPPVTLTVWIGRPVIGMMLMEAA